MEEERPELSRQLCPRSRLAAVSEEMLCLEEGFSEADPETGICGKTDLLGRCSQRKQGRDGGAAGREPSGAVSPGRVPASTRSHGGALEGHTSEFVGFPHPQMASPWLRDSWEFRNFQALQDFCSCEQRRGRCGCWNQKTHCWARGAQKGSKECPGGWQSSVHGPTLRLNSSHTSC